MFQLSFHKLHYLKYGSSLRDKFNSSLRHENLTIDKIPERKPKYCGCTQCHFPEVKVKLCLFVGLPKGSAACINCSGADLDNIGGEKLT